MNPSGFLLELHNSLQSLAASLKFIRHLYLSKVLPMNLLEDEALCNTEYNNNNLQMIEDLSISVHATQVNKLYFSCSSVLHHLNLQGPSQRA